MTALEAQLESIRSSATPKPKFSFQRKIHKPSTSISINLSKPNPVTQQIDSPTRPTSIFYTLSSHAHQYLTLASLPPTIPGQPQSDLTISDLDHCIVDLSLSTFQPESTSETNLPQALKAFHVQNIRSTILILPKISGSILLHDLERCIVVASCHQVNLPLRDWISGGKAQTDPS